MVQAFQHFTGDPLDHGRLDPASDEKKEGAAHQLGESDFHDDNGDSVDETEGTGGKSAVGKSFVFDRSDHCLDDPSEK